MSGIHSISTPPSFKIANGCYLDHNASYFQQMSNNFNKLQIFLDNMVINDLMSYVSFRDGHQASSIKTSSKAGSGEVMINVPYAGYQAYSPTIKKQNGKRGTYPFERMRSDRIGYYANALNAESERLF